MNPKCLLVLGTGNDKKAETAAMDWCLRHGQGLTVMQFLNSNMYHYGHDWIVNGYGRTQFMMHIHNNLKMDAESRATGLKVEAKKRGITVRIITIDAVEMQDYDKWIAGEAHKGYRKIFLPKEKWRLFPLIHRKSLVQRLHKKHVDNDIIAC